MDCSLFVSNYTNLYQIPLVLEYEMISLTVHIDARSSNEWKECVSLTNIPLPDDWAVTSYIGITASTGELSDNHDILSLHTYTDQKVLEAHEAVSSTTVLFETAPDKDQDTRLLRYVVQHNNAAEYAFYIRLNFVTIPFNPS